VGAAGEVVLRSGVAASVDFCSSSGTIPPFLLTKSLYCFFAKSLLSLSQSNIPPAHRKIREIKS
jgi:hypothetical protein